MEIPVASIVPNHDLKWQLYIHSACMNLARTHVCDSAISAVKEQSLVKQTQVSLYLTKPIACV